jgi:hypothetical protein
MRKQERFAACVIKQDLKKYSPNSRDHSHVQMRAIFKPVADIIRRHMGSVFRQSAGSFSLTAALAICLTITISSATSFAQKKNPKLKQPTPTPKAGTRLSGARTVAEPELQLERLPSDPSVENADISITANVRARSLKFETVPNPTVEFPGNPARDAVWEAQRENLPTPVQPGVTYRDIGIRLKITSVFRDIDRIVAEALGEVPLTDDKKSEAQPAIKLSATSSAARSGSQPALIPPPLRERQ